MNDINNRISFLISRSNTNNVIMFYHLNLQLYWKQQNRTRELKHMSWINRHKQVRARGI